jgi:hypothetical protein
MQLHHALQRWSRVPAGILARIFFHKLFWSDSQCPTQQFMIGRMKTSSTRYHRRTLLPIPYSPRPDRLERGLRMLRALRLSLAQSQSPTTRPQQCEFSFARPRRA